MQSVEEVTGMPAAEGDGYPAKVRVIVADDHELMRRVMQQLLARDTEIEVVGCAANGREALQLILQAQSDVVLMDLAMPEMDGVEVLRRLREQAVDVPVIIVSVHKQVSAVLRALEEGAKGYVIKSSMTRELVPAVHAVSEGHTYLSESLKPFAQRGLS